jgi:hypothetical protein
VICNFSQEHLQNKEEQPQRLKKACNGELIQLRSVVVKGINGLVNIGDRLNVRRLGAGETPEIEFLERASPLKNRWVMSG